MRSKESSDIRSINFTVGAVLFVIFFIYFTVVFCVIIPRFENSVPGVLHFSVFTVDAVLTTYCYISCVFTDPGRVPDSWKPDEESCLEVMQVKKKGGGARFCQKCQLPKPPRCHHCRVCNRCVLRMDHHCPWVNNCIGHGNYKAFFLLLIYITAGVVHAMGLLGFQFFQNMHVNARTRRMGRLAPHAKQAAAQIWPFNPAGVLIQTLCFVMTFPLTVGLLMLLCWHVYLVLSNKTTIEYHEGVTAKIRAARSGARYQHPYDVGPCGNLHAVLGPNLACWMIPVPRAADGTGLSYESNLASDGLR
mmetsp:Transcript_17907/g.42949  ORF Transcript_17907/g.42949 Transcript_17907/m.42949 type:complete len:304 (-) Transcript_17907:291-1202(-)